MGKRTKFLFFKNTFAKHKIERETNVPQKEQRTKDYAKVNNGVFVYTTSLSVGELAKKLNVQPSDIIKKLFIRKKLVTINQYLDDETIGELCLEYGYDFKKEEIVNEEDFEKANLDDVDNMIKKCVDNHVKKVTLSFDCYLLNNCDLDDFKIAARRFAQLCFENNIDTVE